MCAKAREFLGLVILVVSGCCGLPIQGESDTLPAEIEIVRTNKNDFAQSEDQTLAMISAGTVMDDLENLDGCWAAYDIYFVGPKELETFAFYRFDLQAETLTFQVLGTQHEFDVADYEGLNVHSASLEIVAPNELVESTTHSFAVDASGTMVAWSNCRAAVHNRLVTVSGDEMKIGYSSAPEEDGGPSGLVFTRVECP